MVTTETALVHDLPLASAERDPERLALTYGSQSLTYGELAQQIRAFASGLVTLGLERGDRVAIYLEKRFDSVVAMFGAACAGGVFVPINPLLKSEQVAHILADCGVRVLVTSWQRLSLVGHTLATICGDLQHVLIVGETHHVADNAPYAVHPWCDVVNARHGKSHRVIDLDVAAILYTSGSTGHPKGVVLSHRNIVAGAKSVAQYLENNAEDTLLAALPLSFDAGFSQLTTGFHVGARIVLLNYLLPRDLIATLEREVVTGLTAVPPLYIQLAQVDWPPSIAQHLRYFANTGGRMPLATLNRLRSLLPRTKPFLMYGLTEAFRATYLPPEEVDRRPDSIGRAIPNNEVLVLREDGTPCDPGEPGELVQRGALVALGYWNDPEKTAERFKPLPTRVSSCSGGLVIPEMAVFSGDTVRKDEEGFLYFVGRRDEMIKTSGYRVSPTEVEEVLYATQLISEAAVFGVPHPELGEAIVAVVSPKPDAVMTSKLLLDACRQRLPLYMVPLHIEIRTDLLPRNPNGKIDRKGLSSALAQLFAYP